MTFIKKYSIVFVIVFALSFLIKPALCFLMFGSLVVYLGIAAAVFLKYIQKNGIACTGVILEYQSDSDGHKTPFIEYTTLTGELIKERPSLHITTDLSIIRSYKNRINQPVPILYDPYDPKKFVLSSEYDFGYFAIALLILAGSLFVILSICSMLGYIKIF